MAIDNPEGSGKKIDPKAAEDLARSMQSTRAAAAAITDSFDQQLKIILQLRDAMASVANTMDKMCHPESGGMSPEKWEQVSEAVKKTSSSLGELKHYSELAEKALKSKLTAALTVASAVLTGLSQGFKNSIAMTKSIVGFFAGVAKAAFNVGKAIISIPFKIMDGLFSMAQKNANAGLELAQAYENVRKQFGDLSGETPKAIFSVATNMDKMNETGVSAYRIFGNLAKRIEAVNKLATEMGASFFTVREEFEKNGVAMMMYQKGMGLSGEQMAAVAQTANRMGTSSTKVLNDMAKQSLAMAKAYGLPAKAISRDMGKAMQDLANFGHLSSKEVAIAATFANKLGVSVDKLTGIMSATATFDQAADGMSKLNQQFGTNIDATQIMMAQNPAEKIEMLRKEFVKTGKDMSKLTYQEKMLIKQSAGIDDAMLDAAFSAKNAGVSLDKISQTADKNEKKTLTQADAMKELGKSIERIVEAGRTFKNLWDAIVQGFEAGIGSSPEFMKLMKNLNIILFEGFNFGMKLGRMFVDLFPGVNKVFKGLSELFSPERFDKLFGGIFKAFDVFKEKGSGKIEDFMSRIQSVFGIFKKQGEPFIKDVLEGYKKFGAAIVSIFSKLGVWLVEELTGMVKKVTPFLKDFFGKLKDPKNVGFDFKASVPEWAKPLVELFVAIKDKLLPELKKLFKVLWEFAKPYVVDGLKYMLLTAFAPTVLHSIAGLIATSMAKSAGMMIKDFFFGSAAQKEAVKSIEKSAMSFAQASDKAATQAAAYSRAAQSATSKTQKSYFKALAEGEAKFAENMAAKSAELSEKAAIKGETQFAKLSAKLGKFASTNVVKMLGKAAIVTQIAVAAVDVGKAINDFSGKLQEEGFDPATATIAAGTTGLINTITFGLLPKKFQGPLATSIAKIGDFFTETLDNVFGPSLSKAIKENLKSTFLIFGGIGDLISGFLKGDQAKIDKALSQIGTAMLEKIKWSFEFLYLELPKLTMQVAIYLYQGMFKAIGWVQHKIADLFHFLGKIPIIGPLFSLLGDLFDKLGNISASIAGLFGKLQSFLKTVDVSGYFKKAWSSIQEFFAGGSAQGGTFFTKLFEWFKTLVAVVEEPYKLLRKVFDIIFSWDTKKTFMENMKEKWGAIVAAFEASGNTIEKLFKNILAGPKSAWDWIKENITWNNMKKIAQDISDGFLEGIKGLPGKAIDAFKSILPGVRKETKTHSPSEAFKEVGQDVSDGFMGPINKIPDKTSKIMKDAVSSSKEGATLPDLSKQLTGMNALLKQLSDNPELIKNIFKLTNLIPNESILKEGIDKIVYLFESINKIIGILQGSDGNKELPKNRILSNLAAVENVLHGFQNNWMAPEGAKESVKLIIGHLSNLSSLIPNDFINKTKSIVELFEGVDKIIASINAPFKNVEDQNSILKNLVSVKNVLSGMVSTPAPDGDKSSVISSIDDALEKLKTYSSGNKLKVIEDVSKYFEKLSGATAKISAQGTIENIKAIQEMVKNTRELDEALTSLPEFKFPAKLESIAKGMGIGGKFAYTVQSKDVVINMRLDITMDAGTVEKVIITRAESTIRNRINYLVEKSSVAGEDSLYIRKDGTQANNARLSSSSDK